MLRMQGVGRVVRNGPRASKFSEGMRVVAAPWPAGTPSGAAPAETLFAKVLTVGRASK